MKTRIKTIILALLTVLTLFLNVEAIYKGNVDETNIFTTSIVTVTLIFFLLYYFYKKEKEIKLTKSLLFLCGLFSFFSVFGNSYLKVGSWNLVFGNIYLFIIACISGISYYLLYKKLFSYLVSFLINKKITDYKSKNKYLSKFLKLFDEHPFIVSLSFILVCWLIYIMAFYPIILSPDPSFQIKQYFNEHTKYIDWVIQLDKNVNMTTHHPVIHTFLLGTAIKIGRVLINDNFGLFIYSFFQVLTLSSVLAYTIAFSKRHNVSNKWRIILLLIYSLVPMFPLYSMSGVKDTYYTAFIILYGLALFDIISSNKKISIKYCIYLFIIILLMATFRNNGLHVIILSLPFIIIYSRKNTLRLTLVFVLFLGSYGLYTKILIPSLGISEGSVREVLSIPFQQTARYVKEHGSEVSKHERNIIDNILGYDDLVERYNPEKADPVKNNYNKYTTNEELKEYFIDVWFKELVKHPTTYIEATMNNIYGYFYPNSLKWYVYSKYDNRITDYNLVDYHYNSLSGIRNILGGYGVVFPYIPVLGLLSNVGFNTWILLILSAYLMDTKNRKYLIVLSPYLLSVLVCIASPVNTYFRYAMPYVFMVPTLLGLFWFKKGTNS